MSWTDVYPILSDEMLATYQAEASAMHQEEMNALFGVAEIINPKQSTHLIVTSISERPMKEGKAVLWKDPDLNLHDLEIKDWNAWLSLSRLFEGAETLAKEKPGVVLRVYLAADLVDLVEPLATAGCEVYLMRGTDVPACKSSLWRFLALEEADRWITITHPNIGPEMVHDVQRTEDIEATGLGLWRIPYLTGGRDRHSDARAYRPIHGVHFGSKGGLPAEFLMGALIWHCEGGTIPRGCVDELGKEGYPLEGSTWPSDDFGDWFLLTAIYPRVAFEGVATCLIWQRKAISIWYTLDIEYVTWANPASEVHLDWKIVTKEEPWKELQESGGIVVRPDAQVFRRERRRIYGYQTAPVAKTILHFQPFEGGLTSLLERAAGLGTRWWIDFSPSLRPQSFGAELFLDRRYQDADVVVCGHYFCRITPAYANWAALHGLDPEHWKEGQIRKLPKLEGPLCLWSTDFSRRFLSALREDTEAAWPELLLAAWIEQGKAVVMSDSPRKMGW